MLLLSDGVLNRVTGKFACKNILCEANRKKNKQTVEKKLAAWIFKTYF